MSAYPSTGRPFAVELGISDPSASTATLGLMANMLALAFAMDVTRNASFVYTLPAAHVFYRAAAPNMNDDFHNTICHTDPGDNAHQPRVHTGVLYAMTALSVFLGKLAALPEGAGTVLDNSLVYVTSCISWGKFTPRMSGPSSWPERRAAR